MLIPLLHSKNWKIIPYLLIVVFSIIVSAIRVVMIPQWGPFVQFAAFVFQVLYLSSIWIFIKTLSASLDKRIPFEDNVVSRILIQVATALLFDLPLYVILFFDISQSGLSFLTREFLA
ncbi:MAG: hypothetical protein ABIR19_09905, partial [Ginsengibacter sp.]